MDDPRLQELLNSKNLPKLMAVSVLIGVVISTIAYYFTGSALLAAAVAATLIAGDYIALKILTGNKDD